MILGPAVLDRDVCPLEVANLTKTLEKRRTDQEPVLGEELPSQPIVGIAFCCARSMRGRNAGAPEITVRKSRLLIGQPDRLG